MTWEMFYLICFGVGLALTVLSLLGGFHHSLHLGAHHHVVIGHHHGHAKAGCSPVNGFTLTAFLCWFGGAGYLLQHYAGFVTPVIFLLASASGLAGAALIFFFIARVLAPHDKSLTAEDTAIVGSVARVSGTIRSDGTGEILYSQNGTRCSSPARSDGGKAIPRDVEVVVMRYERGIAYVRRWDELSPDGLLLSPEGEAHT